MNLPAYIGIRFSVSQKDSAFLSFITRVSMIGLTLGVVALIVVVSVMNGFDSQLKYRILGAVPHMVVHGELPTTPINGVRASAPFLKRDGMLVQSNKNRLVAVYGIDPGKEKEMSVVPSHMVEGRLEDLVPGSYKIAIGKPLGLQLGLWTGDNITLLIPEPSPQGSMVVPKIARVELASTFALQSELDYALVLINLEDLKQIVGVVQHDTRLTLDNIFQVGGVRKLLETEVNVTDWSREYGDFFETVRMEKLMMFILLTLIVMIAAFNTVSGLSMMVKEKQAEIAVLRTMGLSRGRVMQVFIIQGSFIGLVGTVAGVILGVPLAYNVTEVVGFFEDVFGGRMLAGTYFDRVPSDVRLFDIIVIILVSFLISILATLYPAYRAAKVDPANALGAE
ncbi:MAG TPA: lipoprotein-releasing ABC transporter permease subunit [Pseudomonadales bacterium]|jgi:lipoprotein-releasing system permease protein|nr:lipoprotein-releasing ABC transporter permease subunit [Pseudomonadales bacterium]HJP52385.1 lipoprotein-releasing ABC transporter permease subunit [Pseudomonadales bacterium]|tara:strand:- start:1171 stop:2352 length:1182 start_codon:yes stop_codon:yes gene_type:complete